MLKSVLGETMKLVRVHQDKKGLVTLYKSPGRASVRSFYHVEALDSEGNIVVYKSFNNIRRLVDAQRFFEYALRLG
jgi:hypothetical protein